MMRCLTASTIKGVIFVYVLTLLGCSIIPREIPPQYRGQFEFDRTASIEYWNAQSAWPQVTKDLLFKAAIPTVLTIEANKVVVTDAGTGERREDQANIKAIGPNFIKLDLYSNFARTNRTTTFQFDSNGFWLCEDTLFPNYRERFKRSQTQ